MLVDQHIDERADELLDRPARVRGDRALHEPADMLDVAVVSAATPDRFATRVTASSTTSMVSRARCCLGARRVILRRAMPPSCHRI
jgi:hypothetical protein